MQEHCYRPARQQAGVVPQPVLAGEPILAQQPALHQPDVQQLPADLLNKFSVLCSETNHLFGIADEHFMHPVWSLRLQDFARYLRYFYLKKIGLHACRTS